MKSVNIILRDFDGVLKGHDTIGVDRGAWICVMQNIPMKKACGDFDSITQDQYKVICQVTSVDTLPKAKDVTDFEYALTLTHEYDEVYVYGAFGDRLDHLLINVELLKRDSRIRFISASQAAYTLQAGSYTCEVASKYVSLIALEDTMISLKGFKYPLENRIISPKDLYLTSNEVISPDNDVIVHYGQVCMIVIYNETTR